MSTTVTGGGTTYTSYSQDSGYVQTAVSLPSSSVTTAFNGNKPMKITQIRTYAGAFDGAGNISVSIGGFGGTYGSVSIDSSPELLGWLTMSGSFVNGGTNTNFRLDPTTQGGIYFKRSGSGTTTKEDGYTWGGTLYYEYRYIEAPVAPTSFVAAESGSSGLVNFSWVAPSDDGGSTITGYDIYRGTTSGTVTTLILSTTGTGTTASYTAPNSTQYFYHVRAKNAVTTAASTTSVASNVDAATASFVAVAGNPTNMVATPSGTSGQIDLTWTAPATEPPSYGYKIYQNGVLIHTTALSSNPSEAYSVTGLTPGASYSFYVIATALAGDSGASNTATATAPGFAAAPAALAVTSVIATTVLASIEVPKQLRLSWTPPASMTGTGGYKIYRNGVQIAGVGVAGSIIGNMTVPAYIDSDPALVAGTEYSYTIRAYLASSSEIGTLSAPVSGIPVDASVQEVTDTVANLTNAEFDGTYDDLVTVISPTTFSYPVTGGTAYPVQSVDSGFGTVSASLLAIFGNDYAIASATDKAFTFAFSSALPSITTPIGISAAITNKTNAALSGSSFTVHPNTTPGTSTVYYTATGTALTANITTITATGTVNNLDSGAVNDTTRPVISVPTASSFTYTKTSGGGIAADQAETVTTGTVTIPANITLYNAVNKTITDVPRYDTVVYATTVPASGETAESVSPVFPEETARRTSSTAAAEIEYRSGWIG
jgi:hypothetical protein